MEGEGRAFRVSAFRRSARSERRAVGSDASRAQVASSAMVFGGFRDCGLRANARDASFHPSFRVAIGTIVILILITSQPSFSQESLANRMRVISEDLDRQLNDIMASQAVNYTTVNTTGLPYNATTKFNPKGMGQLYNVTNMFIDFIQSKQAYPEGESNYNYIHIYLSLSLSFP